MFKKAIIYGSDSCPFCTKAKNLLEKQGIEYEYRDVTKSEEYQKYVEEYWKSMNVNRPTIPVILIDRFPVGGFKELEQVFA